MDRCGKKCIERDNRPRKINVAHSLSSIIPSSRFSDVSNCRNYESKQGPWMLEGALERRNAGSRGGREWKGQGGSLMGERGTIQKKRDGGGVNNIT